MEQRNPYLVPGAIILAGCIIAGALYFRGAPATNTGTQTPPDEPKVVGTVPAVTAADHILGNPNAPVKIIEYSDLECPFCKRFHYTLKQIMDEYGKDGQVAWVYRHFPLDQLHSKARAEAIALECAGKVGGATLFWQYMDEMMKITPSNNGLDLAELPKLADKLKLDRPSFEKCLTSGEFDAKIQRQVEEALATGGGGTPWSIVVTKNGTQVPIEGAYPYADMKTIIDKALAEK